MPTGVRTANGLSRALRDAQLELARDLVGVQFREPGHGGWLTIVGVTESVVYVESVENPGEPSSVGLERVVDLIKSVVLTGLGGANPDGWMTRGGRPIMNWPGIVATSGWTVQELREKGIAWCRLNPRSGSEAFQ